MNEVDPLNQDLFRSFRTAFLLHQRLMEKALADSGSQPAEAMCLCALASHDGISQRDLADRLHLSRPRVTQVLQELERGDLVIRQVDDIDQRLTRVHLSHEGRHRSRELHRVFKELLDRTIGEMPAAERAELTRLLDSLASHTARVLEDDAEGARQ
ncbi:MAG: MarR family transcriptional regulator [Actinobacteria bacterium]|nr:MarR family transcriptional regulator [Actinomycetota bacterium]